MSVRKDAGNPLRRADEDQDYYARNAVRTTYEMFVGAWPAKSEESGPF
jgi:hypothetical protein